MSSTGVSNMAGGILTGFAHVQQSIGVILRTPIGSRVMRREFGSEVFALIDRPMTDKVILALYAAVAVAIARWEPRFSVTQCLLTGAQADGTLTLEIAGTYYPRGHLGDFTAANDNVRVVIPLVRVA